jgi:hypothetical protein
MPAPAWRRLTCSSSATWSAIPGRTPLRVDAVDYIATRSAIGRGSVDRANPYDFDRDRRVTAADMAAARRGMGRSLQPPARPTPAASHAQILPVRRRSGYDVLGASR